MLVHSLGWEDPLEKGIATHPSILAKSILFFQKKNILKNLLDDTDSLFCLSVTGNHY